VLYRGRFATQHSIRGTLEIVRHGLYGVRLENGNFAWAGDDQLKLVAHRIRLNVELSEDEYNRLTAAIQIRAESCEENFHAYGNDDDEREGEAWRALLQKIEESGDA
jgi:hypothetical protein